MFGQKRPRYKSFIFTQEVKIYRIYNKQNFHIPNLSKLHVMHKKTSRSQQQKQYRTILTPVNWHFANDREQKWNNVKIVFAVHNSNEKLDRLTFWVKRRKSNAYTKQTPFMVKHRQQIMSVIDYRMTRLYTNADALRIVRSVRLNGSRQLGQMLCFDLKRYFFLTLKLFS